MKFNRSDQELVDKFIKELVKEVVKKFSKEVDFVILYGSAARGEFVKGVSDIDLLIQTKDQSLVGHIKEYSTLVFWKLNKKYKLGFEKACSIRKSENLLARILDKLESKAQLYTPLFVFGPEDIDWKQGKVLKKDLVLGANLIASQAAIFYKFKKEGKVYYGRDIRRVIKPQMGFWERYKNILVPQHLMFAALFTFLILPKRAVKYCNKAVLYEIDSALIYLNKLKTNVREAKISELKKITGLRFKIKSLSELIEFNLDLKYNSINPKYFKILEEALEYKIKGFKGSRLDVFKYIMRCLRFIMLMNLAVVFKRK